MIGLFETLQKIKQRPGMYLGQPSITALFTFISGYEFAREELGIPLTQSEENFHRNFQLWLQKRFEIQTVNSWAKIILFYSRSEQEAFDYFFELLTEFSQQHQTSTPEKITA